MTSFDNMDGPAEPIGLSMDANGNKIMAGRMRYDELKKELKDLPLTWYPDLLKTLVEASIENGCWLPGDATAFVKRLELGGPGLISPTPIQP